MAKQNITLERSYKLALIIFKTYKQVSTANKEFVLSKQLLRSGTAVGALIREAQNAESKKDFIHKLSIAQKECDESIYWINLLYDSEYLGRSQFEALNTQCTEMLKILRSIILSTKRNMK